MLASGMDITLDWTPIPNRPGYEIHPDGRVRSNLANNGWRILATRLGNMGYPMVSIYKKRNCVHRLLAETFIPVPNRPERLAVNHKDGVKTNNALQNLEWVSWSENNFHATRVLKKRIGEQLKQTKLTVDEVYEMRAWKAFGARVVDLARVYGIAVSTAYGILSGHRWVAATNSARMHEQRNRMTPRVDSQSK
jgi:hypothetical protein